MRLPSWGKRTGLTKALPGPHEPQACRTYPEAPIIASRFPPARPASRAAAFLSHPFTGRAASNQGYLNVAECHTATMMIWFAATAALAAAGPAPPAPRLTLPPALARAAGGEFVDRAGAHHPWQINKAHALLWDGQSFVPAGVILHISADA